MRFPLLLVLSFCLTAVAAAQVDVSTVRVGGSGFRKSAPVAETCDCAKTGVCTCEDCKCANCPKAKNAEKRVAEIAKLVAMLEHNAKTATVHGSSYHVEAIVAQDVTKLVVRPMYVLNVQGTASDYFTPPAPPQDAVVLLWKNGDTEVQVGKYVAPGRRSSRVASSP